MICTLCPRNCKAERAEETGAGVCRMGTMPRIARAALHMWEEPCISGTRGSGAVFFSGCGLRCVFCQNERISQKGEGKQVTPKRLSEIFRELEEQGAHNINLVTAAHFVPAVLDALALYRPNLPIVYNSSGYESVETLRMLDGAVDIYLPDYKYIDPNMAAMLSGARDYPDVAHAVLLGIIAVGQAGGIHRIADQMDPIHPLGAADQIHGCRMEMDEIGNDLARHAVVGQDGAQHPGRAVMQPDHPVESMCGNGGPAINGGFGGIIIRAGMAQRHGDAQRRRLADHRESVPAFRRKG